MRQILIINPNSNAQMTNLLRTILTPLPLPETFRLNYYTAPSGVPPSLNSPEDGQLSANLCFPDLLPQLDQYHAFVVACFSPHHPLIAKLRGAVPAEHPVVGVYEESVHFSRNMFGTHWGVLTTGQAWGDIITKDLDHEVRKERYLGVEACGVHASELADPKAREKVKKSVVKLAERVEGSEGVFGIVLGCVGFGELGEVVKEVAGGRVRVVDCVRTGLGGAVSGLLGWGRTGD